MTSLTPRAQTVYDILCHAAEHGLPCPTDTEICDTLGLVTQSSVGVMVRKMEADGHLRIERPFRNSRIVEIVATGDKTAPTKRTAPKRKPPHRVVRVEEVRGTSENWATEEQRMARVKGGPPMVTERIEVDVVGHPKTCQYPFGDGPYRFCEKKTQDGSSYCRAHHVVCWRQEQYRHQKYRGAA